MSDNTFSSFGNSIHTDPSDHAGALSSLSNEFTERFTGRERTYTENMARLAVSTGLNFVSGGTVGTTVDMTLDGVEAGTHLAHKTMDINTRADMNINGNSESEARSRAIGDYKLNSFAIHGVPF